MRRAKRNKPPPLGLHIGCGGGCADMEVGVRVVRGPDWKWDAQDGGEGHVGTLVELGGQGASPAHTAVVQWDSGARTNYRVGYLAAFDLRLFDNAPVGVKHPNINCSSCTTHGITGFRWKCLSCNNYDLCTQCYMSDKHDVTHIFCRFETASSRGVDMPKRQGSIKIQSKGIFVGAKVVRGQDWDWNNQDGGEGKVGRVVDIRGWDNESSRSVANVTWSSGSTNVYRLGHKGKVDLMYIQPALGIVYYRDHLPVLGPVVAEAATTAGGSPGKAIGTTGGLFSISAATQFNVGDKVKVLLDVDTLKVMQEGHGGWNPRMTEFVGKLGTVHRVTDKGDIRVQYEGCNNRWTFHPGALTKVMSFAVGDMVKILDNESQVMLLQKDHGEWILEMKKALGKLGRVTKVYLDGDLRVAVEGQVWTFNPLCVMPVPGSVTELNNTNHDQEEHAHPELDPLLSDNPVSSESLVSEAAKGHTELVQQLLAKFPKQVDMKSSGKTALQVASHQGYLDIVQLLADHEADVEMKDDDGDTALHYAAFGNQPDVIKFLLERGANIDAVNNARCSPLHVAVNKQHVPCIKVLLQARCDVNIQDIYGDTALHDAIGKDKIDVIELLVSIPSIDFSRHNNRGFNVLHHAALKGNHFATLRLIAKSRQMVDVKKDDGFAALHVAALNGHYQVTETLLNQGQCDMDIQNNRKQTALLLAVNQGHCELVELLVIRGANVNAVDEDEDSAAHLALMRTLPATTLLSSQCPVISAIHAELFPEAGPGDPSTIGAAMAVFLAQRGANLSLTNRRFGKTPLDLAPSPTVKLAMQQAAQGSFRTPPPTSRALYPRGLDRGAPLEPGSSEAECIVCCESPATVMFEPCRHRQACLDCCARMKKCITCHTPISRKLGPDGQPVACSKMRNSSAERLRYLEMKLQEFEDAQNCSICMERRRNVVFLCGHSACVRCAQTLKYCHMCRNPITQMINIYA